MARNKSLPSRFRFVVRVVDGCDELGDCWYPIKHWRLNKLVAGYDDAARAMAYSIEAGCYGFPGGGPYTIDVVIIDVDAPGGSVAYEPARLVVESKMEIHYTVKEIDYE